MIYTTPLSSYNMQNAHQLGQMMQDQGAYTPTINPFSSPLVAPAGYSLNQWQQELSLARQQYFGRPLLAGGNLLASSFGTAMMFTPLISEMIPEWGGAVLAKATERNAAWAPWQWGSGYGLGTLGNIASGINHASHAFSSGIGSTIGEGIGWSIGHGARGILRIGERSANYMTGGLFSGANNWLGNNLGFKFSSSLSGYIDKGATGMMGAFDSIKASVTGVNTTAKGLQASKGVAGLLARGGSLVGGLIGSFLSPAFLIKQALIDRAIDYGADIYENYSTRLELNRELLAKGGRVLRFGDADFSQGIDGGFTRGQREQLVRHLDIMAANDPTVRINDWFGMGAGGLFGGHRKYSENLKELKAILSVSTDMGMLDMSKSLDEVEKRFDNIVKVVKKLSKITGKSKGELAMALASTQQSEARFDIADAAASLQRKIYAATASGASLQTILQESAMGAQMGVQAGIGKAAGADFMTLSRNVYGRMYRKNMLDRGDIDMLGGEQGVVSTLASGFMSMTNNNIFRSQLAMFFDPNTGGFNRKKFRSYLESDDKGLRNSMLERHIAMSTQSYNSMTGMMEVGGELNAKMPFVMRALQHGDISQRDLLRMSKKFMREAEMVYGTGEANRMMSSFFMNNFGPSQGMLLMKALRDDSLLKPDIKEQLAVSRKQLEDRYSAEYQRANGMGFWRNITTVGAAPLAAMGAAFMLGTPVGWGMIGLGLAAGATASYFGLDKKLDNWFMGWGQGAMSREMLQVHSLNDSWFDRTFNGGQTGIEKLNDIDNYSVDVLTSARAMGAITKEDMAKIKISRSPLSVLSNNISDSKSASYFLGKNVDNIKATLKENDDLKRLHTYLVTGDKAKLGKYRIKADKLNLGFAGVYKTSEDGIEEKLNLRAYRTEKATDFMDSVVRQVLLDNPDLSVEQAKKVVNDRIRGFDKDQAISDLTGHIDAMSKLGRYSSLEVNGIGGSLFNSHILNFGLHDKYLKGNVLGAFGTVEASYKDMMADIKKTRLARDFEDSIFVAFHNDQYTQTEINDYYANMRQKGKKYSDLSKVDKDWVRTKIEDVRGRAVKDLIQKGYFKSGYTEDNAQGLIDTYNAAIGNDRKMADLATKIKLKIISNNVHLKTGKSVDDIINDIMSKSGEDRTKAINDYIEKGGVNTVGEKSDAGDDTGKDSDVATGSSALNRELLNVLKGLKTTMDNINVRMGETQLNVW